jgi:hypothetical protein
MYMLRTALPVFCMAPSIAEHEPDQQLVGQLMTAMGQAHPAVILAGSVELTAECDPSVQRDADAFVVYCFLAQKVTSSCVVAQSY